MLIIELILLCALLYHYDSIRSILKRILICNTVTKFYSYVVLLNDNNYHVSCLLQPREDIENKI